MEQNKREQFIIRRIGGTTYKVRVCCLLYTSVRHDAIRARLSPPGQPSDQHRAGKQV